MTERKRLSLCVPVRNDEKVLSGCLESLGTIADEVIVADLGSRDRTVDIARQAGAMVFQTKWNSNNSAVKNFCLEQAQGRWVLFLQPQERIPQENLEELLLLLINPNAEGYLLHGGMPLQDYGICSPVQSLRLLRNRKDYRFQHRVFERIPDEQLGNIEESGIQLVTAEGSGKSRNAGKYGSLLKRELEQYPEDSYLQYMQGLLLLNRQQNEESVKWLSKAHKGVHYGYLFAPHLMKCLAWSLLSLQKLPEAREILEEGIAIYPVYTDFLVLRAEVHKQLGQYEEAVHDLQESRKLLDRAGYMIPAPEIDPGVADELLEELATLQKGG